jgi:hypothetical protein
MTYSYSIFVDYSGTGCYFSGSTNGNFSTGADDWNFISGWVLDAKGNHAPAGIAVEAFCSEGTNLPVYKPSTTLVDYTDSTGHFNITGLGYLSAQNAGGCIQSYSTSYTGYTVAVCNPNCPVAPYGSIQRSIWNGRWNETMAIWGAQNDIVFVLPMVTDENYVGMVAQVSPITDNAITSTLELTTNPATLAATYASSSSAPADVALSANYQQTFVVPGGTVYTSQSGSSLTVTYSVPTTGLVYFDGRGSRQLTVGWALPTGYSVTTASSAGIPGSAVDPGSLTCSTSGPVRCGSVSSSTQSYQVSFSVTYVAGSSGSVNWLPVGILVAGLVCDTVTAGLCTPYSLSADIADTLVEGFVSPGTSSVSDSFTVGWTVNPPSSGTAYYMEDYSTTSTADLSEVSSYVWQCTSLTSNQCQGW